MAIADVRTFWSAVVRVFARVLLTCAAALGFTTAARTAAGPAVAAGRTAPRADRSRERDSDRDRTIPAPRRDRDRDRTLPPTMKQRIRAEAHGSSPAARSASPTGEPALIPAPAPVRIPADGAGIPAPRPRAHEALCD